MKTLRAVVGAMVGYLVVALLPYAAWAHHVGLHPVTSGMQRAGGAQLPRPTVGAVADQKSRVPLFRGNRKPHYWEDARCRSAEA